MMDKVDILCVLMDAYKLAVDLYKEMESPDCTVTIDREELDFLIDRLSDAAEDPFFFDIVKNC